MTRQSLLLLMGMVALVLGVGLLVLPVSRPGDQITGVVIALVGVVATAVGLIRRRRRG